ncbi:MAG: PilN domain-containing protein [Legionellales bacterium]|nr:PilN domain-containing protein [Legionellales bacterium]
MTSINLLPWRVAARKERLRHFLIALAVSASVAVLVLIPVYLIIHSLVETQKSRNTYLQSEITKLDAQIAEIKQLQRQREDLIARMNVIRQLQESRTMTVHIFDEIVNVIPAGVYITKIEKTGPKFAVIGVADANQSISEMLRKIDNSTWLAHAVLVNIDSKQTAGVSSHHFDIQMFQRIITAVQDSGSDF